MKRLLLFTIFMASLMVPFAYAEDYNITLGVLHDEVEEGLYALLYANCTDSSGVQHEDNVTFTITGASFTWNSYTDRYEATIVKNTPQTVVFNTISASNDSENATSTFTLNNTATVTWTNSLIDQVEVYMMEGDIIGALLAVNTDLLGVTVFYSVFMMGITLAIYNYTGWEAALFVWMLGWGTFSAVVHGAAVSIGLIIMSLSGGILLAKLFLDRRTS